MKDNFTEIVVVLDRSGSMSSVKSDVIGGFNSFIKSQQEEEGAAIVTAVQFDTKYETLYSGRDVQEVEELTDKIYEPRGMTALLDAVGRTIVDVDIRLGEMHKDDRPSKVIMVIMTDGHENSSREYTRDKVQAMIKEHREKHSWEFVYLGADDQAFAEAQGMGIPVGNVAKYSQGSRGTEAAYVVLREAVSAYRVNPHGIGSNDLVVNSSTARTSGDISLNSSSSDSSSSS